MKWINVEEDLPPSGIKCLVFGTNIFTPGKTITGWSSKEEEGDYIIIEATFCPKTGWKSPIGFLKVATWCPLSINENQDYTTDLGGVPNCLGETGL